MYINRWQIATYLYRCLRNITFASYVIYNASMFRKRKNNRYPVPIMAVSLETFNKIDSFELCA